MDCLIPQDVKKNRISEGCFYAIGSYAGYELVKIPQDNDYGVDFQLMRQIKRNGRIHSENSILDFQLKCTKNWTDKGSYIVYNLKSKNYNDIISRNKDGSTVLILVVMCLPENSDKWMDISSEEILFRKNMYWFYTNSKELLESEDSTKRIHIPKSNQLDKQTFHQLVNQFSTMAVVKNGR
ncbi:MAG: DUF4365 domain-containing protein [Dehalococcoidia bacterium]